MKSQKTSRPTDPIGLKMTFWIKTWDDLSPFWTGENKKIPLYKIANVRTVPWAPAVQIFHRQQIARASMLPFPGPSPGLAVQACWLAAFSQVARKQLLLRCMSSRQHSLVILEKRVAFPPSGEWWPRHLDTHWVPGLPRAFRERFPGQATNVIYIFTFLF